MKRTAPVWVQYAIVVTLAALFAGIILAMVLGI
jgi:hypothetical protein